MKNPKIPQYIIQAEESLETPNRNQIRVLYFRDNKLFCVVIFELKHPAYTSSFMPKKEAIILANKFKAENKTVWIVNYKNGREIKKWLLVKKKKKM